MRGMSAPSFRKGDRARLISGDTHLVGHFVANGTVLDVAAKRGDRVLVVDPKRLSMHCWLKAERLEKIR